MYAPSADFSHLFVASIYLLHDFLLALLNALCMV